MKPDLTVKALPWLRRVLVVALVLSAGCGSEPPLPEETGRPIADTFLDEIRKGNVDTAWNGTSAEFKSLMGLDSFRRYVKSHPALKNPANFQEGKRIDKPPMKLAECVYAIDKPKATKVRLILAPENDVWKVERLEAD